MNRVAAIRLAIKALTRERRRVAPEAEMYRLYGIRSLEHVKAFKQYGELNAAIETLTREMTHMPAPRADGAGGGSAGGDER